MDEYDFKMISVKPETHQRFRMLTVTLGLSNDETLILLMDEYKKSKDKERGWKFWQKGAK